MDLRRLRFALLASISMLLLQGVAIAQETTKRDAPSRFVERPGLLEFSGLMIVRPVPPGELAATGVTPQRIEEIRARARARIQEHLVEYIPATDESIVRVPPGETENGFSQVLMATGDYQYAEPDWICHPTDRVPNDPSYWQQWHHSKLRSPLAWDLSVGDPGLVIAIVDGGVQLDHPDLAGALVPGYNSDDDLAQTAGGDVGDVDGHGTFVAGLAGAIGNNRTHVAGMGWDFSIMPIRYYNQPGGGYLHNILEGARWAAENGARCVSVSQTGVEYSSVQTTGAYVKGLGALLFWAAGNDQRDLSWFDWDDVIVVGATDPNDDRASFSAYGLAVDVFAPGTNIYSTGMPSALAVGSGTSASTPMAAGVCALVWSHRPRLTPDQVEQCLFTGCVDLGPPGEDPSWGWGRIDSRSSVEASGVVDLKVNGVDGPLVTFRGSRLEVELSLQPGLFEGVSADWWVLCSTPSGWFHHSPPAWLPGVGVSHQGPLVATGPVTVLDWSGLPPGYYQFSFGVDTKKNGLIDLAEMIYDVVEVTVY